MNKNLMYEVKAINTDKLVGYLNKKTLSYMFKTKDNKGREITPLVYVFKENNQYNLQIRLNKNKRQANQFNFEEIDLLVKKISYHFDEGQFLYINEKGFF